MDPAFYTAKIFLIKQMPEELQTAMHQHSMVSYLSASRYTVGEGLRSLQEHAGMQMYRQGLPALLEQLDTYLQQHGIADGEKVFLEYA